MLSPSVLGITDEGIVREPTLLGAGDLTVKQFENQALCPGHCIAIDKTILLTVLFERATTNLVDSLTDLAAPCKKLEARKDQKFKGSWKLLKDMHMPGFCKALSIY